MDLAAMQVLQLLFVLATIALKVKGAQVCGHRTAKGRAYVRNGQDAANSTEIPWNVVVYDMMTATGPMQICGGSLIKTDYFISAAHCFYSKNSKNRRSVSDFAATVGSLYRDWNSTEDTKQELTVWIKLLEKVSVKE